MYCQVINEKGCLMVSNNMSLKGESSQAVQRVVFNHLLNRFMRGNDIIRANLHDVVPRHCQYILLLGPTYLFRRGTYMCETQTQKGLRLLNYWLLYLSYDIVHRNIRTTQGIGAINVCEMFTLPAFFKKVIKLLVMKSIFPDTKVQVSFSQVPFSYHEP